MTRHVHSAPAKDYAFGFKAHALFEGRGAAQFDFSAGAQDAVPGNPESSAQSGGNLARAARQSSGPGNGAIGGDLAGWNLANGRKDSRSDCCRFIHREQTGNRPPRLGYVKLRDSVDQHEHPRGARVGPCLSALTTLDDIPSHIPAPGSPGSVSNREPVGRRRY